MNLTPQQYRAVFGTVVFHIILIGILLITGFMAPAPLPEEQALVMNFGMDEDGNGLLESSEIIKPAISPASHEKAKEEYLTQDIEEAPALPEKKKNEENLKKAEEDKKLKEEQERLLREEAERKRQEVLKKKANDLAKQAFSNQGDNSQGNTGNDGNQGNPNGIPGGNSNIGGLSDGSIKFALSGRNPQSLPKPDYNLQVEGIVVVEITVNRDGIVTDAVAGVKGSTTLNAYLLKQAREAALKATFDRKADAEAYQKGTITYYFKLN